MLAGLLRLRLLGPSTYALISIDPIPDPTWQHTWLNAMRRATSLQNGAVAEWLNVVLALLLTILMMAGASALIALFAHATARRYEVALRAVVGATRKQITSEHLRKAAANVAIAFACGVPLGLVAAFIANRTWPGIEAGLRAGEWLAVSFAFTAGLAALVARSAAARMSKSGWLGDVLAPEARNNPGYGAEDLRGALLHMQFAFTFALLAAALLVWQQAQSSWRPATSIAEARYVTRVTIDEHAMPEQRRQIFRQLEHSGFRAATPGALIGVGSTDRVMSNCGRCSVANMMLPMFPLRTQQHVVGAGFFEVSGFPLRYGREFETSDAGVHNVVVNDTFANLAFQGQHAIGKTIQVGGLRGSWYTVVGVVRDLPIAGLISFTPDDHDLVISNIPGREAAIYFYTGERPPAVADVVTTRPVQPRVAGLTSGRMQTLTSLWRDARAPAGWFAGVLSVLAVTAAVIAVLSLGALTLLNVRQRELEIAAHRSVGARRRDIIKLVVKESVLTVGRGTVAGIILSVALARAIQMVLPQMKIVDAATIGITAGILALSSVIAAILPARAAARVMPAQIHT